MIFCRIHYSVNMSTKGTSNQNKTLNRLYTERGNGSSFQLSTSELQSFRAKELKQKHQVPEHQTPLTLSSLLQPHTNTAGHLH